METPEVGKLYGSCHLGNVNGSEEHDEDTGVPDRCNPRVHPASGIGAMRRHPTIIGA